MSGGAFDQSVVPLFSTPLVIFDFSDADNLNSELVRVIQQKEESEPGVIKSNVGGWHSKNDFLTWDEGPVGEFKHKLNLTIPKILDLSLVESERDARFDLKVSAWALVVRNGQYNAAHNHPSSHWSGVYYADSGDPDASSKTNGCLELFDPRLGVDMVGLNGSAFATPCILKPSAGRMIFFPSWVKHMVHPFYGQRARVSIAFNVSFLPTQ